MKLFSILPLMAFAFSLAGARPAQAISETGYHDVFMSQVLPFYEKGETGSFEGVAGVKIAYRVYENPDEKGALVIVNGRTEFLSKYSEVIYDLANATGYSIYILDHRGQGYSGRMLADPQIGYVENFDDYVTDLDTFIRTVVDARPHERRYLLSHSMGGPIAALYLAAHPGEFDAAVLSAPMFEINTSPFPEAIAYSIVSLACLFGQGQHYALGQHAYDPDLRLSASNTTTSQARFDMMKMFLDRDPEIALGGASNRWIKESMEATTKARNLADQVATPVLLLQAGQDSIVRLGGQDEFCSKAKDCRKAVFPESRHEIFMERDETREPALAQTIQFLLAH